MVKLYLIGFLKIGLYFGLICVAAIIIYNYFKHGDNKE